MKHSILALPALLRPALFLASAAQHSFSVQDDLLAFPQYDVKFSEDFVSEAQAQEHLRVNEESRDQSKGAPPSQIEHYRGQASSRAERDEGEDVKAEYEQMMLDGQPYLCTIPVVARAEQAADANDTLSKQEEEKELARATDRGWELLSGMQGSCIYFISGWWSYRFCYNEGVRQFHQLPPSRGVPPFPPVEDPGVDGYTLGMYKGEEKVDGKSVEGGEKGREHEVQSALDASEGELVRKKRASSAYGELVQRGESRYLVQKLEGGTKCDLTGKGRRVEVQFHCNQYPNDRISLIKETSTCAYLLIIHTPRLCNDVAFLPPSPSKPNSISCAPILGLDQIDDYKRDLKFLQSREAEARIWEANADAAKVFLGEEVLPLQVVGDVVVGGRAWVPEDVKLEKSAIVGGGKETYIDTVASSDGKTLGKEDLEKLGLGDPKNIETLRKRLEEMAQGHEWKLEVVDTPRGREYRGIIGTESEEEEKKKKKEEGEKKEKEKGKGQKKDGDKQEGSQEEYYKEEL